MTLLITVLLLIFPASGIAADGKQTGEDAGNSALQFYGSSQGFTDRIANPVTAGSPMTTMSGQSFTANVSCSSSQNFLKITASVGNTGDVTAGIEQDRDMDSAIDHTATFTPISYICANGFISCTPGTDTNCQPYKWVADSTLKLNASAVSATGMSGCICINNACNGGSPVTIENILNILGGGAVGAIQTVSSNYATSQVLVSGSTITFQGQNTANCQQTQSSASDLDQYYKAATSDDPYVAASASSGFESAATSATSSNSYYQTLSASPMATNSAVEQKSCTLTRTVQVNTTAVTQSGSGSATPSVDGFIYGRVSLTASWGYKIEYASAPIGVTPSWTSIYTYDPPPSSSASNLSATMQSSGGCTSYGAQTFTDADLGSSKVLAKCTSPQSLNLSWSYSFTVSTDTTGADTITDNCTAFANNPKCELYSEKADNVTTYSNYNPTGASAQTNCKEIVGATTNTVCRDWWLKTRTYSCEVDQTSSYDISEGLSRSGKVQESLSDDQATFSYIDTAVGDTVQTHSKSPAEPDPGDCEPACKVSKPLEGINAGSDQDTNTINYTDYQVSSTPQKSYYYKLCDNNTCPLAAGETQDTDCGCPNDFAEASAKMDVLKQASKDMICSSGVTQ